MGVYTEFPREIAGGSLLAWNPVRQKEAWRVVHKGPWNGGTLATAGNLVFQGTADGRFVAYAADSGKQLWEAPAGSGVIAAPITYSIDGEQYVSVMAGWGGIFALYGGDAAASNRVRSIDGRLLTFKLGGTATLPPPEPTPLRARAFTAPPTASKQTLAEGEVLFARNCMACHGAGAVGGGVIPDLRHISPEIKTGFRAIVRDGALHARGMPGFARLPDTDVDSILAYLQKRAAEEGRGPARGTPRGRGPRRASARSPSRTPRSSARRGRSIRRRADSRRIARSGSAPRAVARASARRS
jgi:quinohemoprotein ethanol dehydrogenase